MKHINHGAEYAEDKHPLVLGFLQIITALLEFCHLLVLTVEDLGDLDAGQVFGQVGVDVGGAVLHLAVDLTGELAEDDGEKHHEGYEAQHHQG